MERPEYLIDLINQLRLPTTERPLDEDIDDLLKKEKILAVEDVYSDQESDVSGNLIFIVESCLLNR